MHRLFLLILPALLLALTATPPTEASPSGARKAPIQLYPEPASFLLLRLGGERAFFHYTPGSLDRAANLQARLEVVARTFERWTDERLEVAVFVLNRREWREANIDVEYGIPVRVGAQGIAAPSRGDSETIELWSKILNGRLPTVIGTPMLGTPQEVASLVVADTLVQLQAGEIMVDYMGLGGNEPWVRALIAHLAVFAVAERAGTDRPRDLAALYGQFQTRHDPRTFSLRDYKDTLNFEDWLYFQAQFHFAARTIFEKEGKDSVKKMVKLRKKSGGTILADRLRRKYEKLDEWLTANFSAVSFKK